MPKSLVSGVGALMTLGTAAETRHRFDLSLFCALVGEPSGELTHQHCADAHPHHHVRPQESQEPEEEGPSRSAGHSTGVL